MLLVVVIWRVKRATVTGDQSIGIGGNVKVTVHSAIGIGGDDVVKALNQSVIYTDKSGNLITNKTLRDAYGTLTGKKYIRLSSYNS